MVCRFLDAGNDSALQSQPSSTGGTSTLSELPNQYADWAHWQRHRLQDETLESEPGYWKQQLGGSSWMFEADRLLNQTSRWWKSRPSTRGGKDEC